MSEQEEMERDIRRVVELASRHLSPEDTKLLYWAVGMDEKTQREKWDEMQEPLFIG